MVREIGMYGAFDEGGFMSLQVLSCGMGTNSLAMLIGMHERKERPDLILFADTGAERPHTYAGIDPLNVWLASVGFPLITVVQSPNTTLEKDCLRRNALPAVAYGYKSCSIRFKAEPQEKYLNHFIPAIEAWARGEKVVKLIGFDAGEPGRAKHFEDEKCLNRYPLVEWGWGRPECIDAISRAGMNQPGKSSCFFCPNMRQAEIREQAQHYPELTARALDMEARANLTKVSGLGRDFSWNELLKTSELFEFPTRFNNEKCVCGVTP